MTVCRAPMVQAEAMGSTPPPVIILVRPQLGENIGAAARAMMNCGLTDLRLVAPRDGWPTPAALPMAAGGSSIIENAMIYDIVADATHDLTFLAALSARRRDMPVRRTDPRGVIPDILAHAGKAGLMFGPEQSGLDNDDVVRAEIWFNKIRTISADFVQVASDGTRAEGKLVFRRPSRMKIT